MRARALLLSLALLIVPSVHAETIETAAETAACAAPCGYISPIIDLVFPEKLDCSAGNVLGVEASPADCMSPPTEGNPVTLDGTLRIYWDISYDGTYPADPTEPIEVSFGRTSTHPGWIDMKVEPDTFVLDNVALFDPRNMKVEQKPDGSVAVFYWYEPEVSVTFTRTGEPTEDELESMQSREGIQYVFLKVRSSPSGSQYKEAYGIELFRFHGANDESIAPMVTQEHESPNLGLGVVTLALAGLAMRRRP